MAKRITRSIAEQAIAQLSNETKAEGKRITETLATIAKNTVLVQDEALAEGAAASTARREARKIIRQAAWSTLRIKINDQQARALLRKARAPQPSRDSKALPVEAGRKSSTITASVIAECLKCVGSGIVPARGGRVTASCPNCKGTGRSA